MKNFLLCLLIAGTLLSCSKNNDDDEEELVTYATITNNHGSPLDNVVVGELIGSSKARLIKNIGSLDQNASSERVEIRNTATDYVVIYFDKGTKTYMIMQPYGFNPGTNISFYIRSDVNITEIQKSADLYPK